MKKAIIFDKSILKRKINEGMAVQQAVLSGACNCCKHLHRCESDTTFKFPSDACCMQIMRGSDQPIS